MIFIDEKEVVENTDEPRTVQSLEYKDIKYRDDEFLLNSEIEVDLDLSDQR